MFVKRLHTDADVVHGDTCANLWVMYASVGIGGYHLLHLTWVGRGGCSISELLISVGAWNLTLHINNGGPTWNLEKR